MLELVPVMDNVETGCTPPQRHFMEAITFGNVLTIVNLVGGGLFGLFYRAHLGVAERALNTERELANYKLHVAETYMTSKAMENVLAKLDRIEDKLDAKQDKPR